jgi:chromosome segregation ATPase
VFNSYINLKEEVSQLKEQNESVQREYNEVLQERDAARADVENLSVQVQEVSAQAADLRRAVTSYEAKLAESHRKAEAAGHSVGEARDTIETLTFQLQEEKLDKERVRDEIQKLRHSLQDLRFRWESPKVLSILASLIFAVSSCEERSSSYADLQERHQALISQVRDYDSLVKGLRASASDALEGRFVLCARNCHLMHQRFSEQGVASAGRIPHDSAGSQIRHRRAASSA